MKDSAYNGINRNLSWEDDAPFVKNQGKSDRKGLPRSSKKFTAAHKQSLQDASSVWSSPPPSAATVSDRILKRQQRDRHRKQHQKYRNCAAEIDSSDESEGFCHSPRSRSNSMTLGAVGGNSQHVSPVKQQPLSTQPPPSFEQLTAALQASSLGASGRKYSFSGGLSGGGRHPRTPSAGSMTMMLSSGGGGGPHSDLRLHNPHQLQHSPYYRALFGSPVALRVISSTGAEPGDTPCGAEAGSGTDSPVGKALQAPAATPSAVTTADGSSEEDARGGNWIPHTTASAQSSSPLGNGNLFGPDEEDSGSPVPRERRSPQVAFASNEDAWPALPRVLAGPPKTPSSFGARRKHGAALTPGSAQMRSPGRSGAGSAESKRVGAESGRKWLRSDKYLNKLFTAGGAAAPSTTAKKAASMSRSRDASSSDLAVAGSGGERGSPRPLPTATPLIASPRRLRFPEPGAGLSSPSSSFKGMPSPLFLGAGVGPDDVAVSLFSPIHSPPPHHASRGDPAAPADQATPDYRHRVAFPSGGHGASSPETPQALVSPGPSSGADVFQQSLTPGLLSPRPTLFSGHGRGHQQSARRTSPHHGPISFARYLALTASPTPLSGDGQALRAKTDEDTATDDDDDGDRSALALSCRTELDPRQVVRVLHEAFLGPRARGPDAPAAAGSSGSSNNLQCYSAMLHSGKSHAEGLNLATGAGADVRQLRPARRWDDPDTESDEEGPAAAEQACAVTSGLLLGDAALRFYAQYQPCSRRRRSPAAARPAFCDPRDRIRSALDRCPFFRTMTREAAQPVDAAWFHSQVYPTYYAPPQKWQEFRLEQLTGSTVLSEYVDVAALVHHLADSLCFEDSRVSSSRLEVLKALYRHSAPPPRGCCDQDRGSRARLSASTRQSVVRAVDQALAGRLARCLESARLSAACEVDTNYLAKRGFLGVRETVGDGGEGQAAAVAVLTGCDIDGVTGGTEERPAYKTRDSDTSLLELLKFTAACDLEELCGELEGPAAAQRADSVVAPSGQRLCVAAGAFVSAFRCYGFKLGNSSELVEQPDLLGSLLDALEGLLLWGHALGIAFHHHSGTESSRSDKAGRGGSVAEQQPPEEPLLNVVCRLLLRAVTRHWSDGCNFAQDVAFLRVAELLLAAYTPVAGEKPQMQSRGGLPSLGSQSAVGEVVARRCLRKMLRKTRSAHFKVALQAQASLQNPTIQGKYFMPAFTSRGEPVDPHFTVFRSPSATSYSALLRWCDQGLPLPLLPPAGRYHAGSTADMREALLGELVEALRANRGHWHPAVQGTSAAALDALFERVQEAEDVAEDARDAAADGDAELGEESASDDIDRGRFDSYHSRSGDSGDGYHGEDDGNFV